MGENSAISWTTHTFNAWWGCVEVSPECDNCYARTWANYTGRKGLWGPTGEAQRLPMADAYWRQLPKWQKVARAAGERHRVFCFSMADVFERQTPNLEPFHDLDSIRRRLWAAIVDCPDLDFLLLTKRPQNILGMVPSEWLERWPTNIWPGTTVGLQSSAWRLDHLMPLPAWMKWVSVEPLLGPLDLRPWLRPDGIGWVIVGGESGGPTQRSLVESAVADQRRAWIPTDQGIDAVRSLRDQAQAAGVAFHFKQWGGPKPTSGGRLLDGRTWDEVPTLEEQTTHARSN